jgi:urease accessory protein
MSATPLARPQRVHGSARLTVCSAADGTHRIADLYQRAPARMLFPSQAPDTPVEAVVLTTSGGLTGGDRLEISITADPGAAVVATSQAAEKIYRSDGPDCEVRIRLAAAQGASVEWLMQETILFDGACLSRRTEADVAPSARLLAVESLVFGRSAMGERWTRGRLHDSWRIRRDGRLIWVDALALDDVAAERDLPFGIGDAAGSATIVLVAPDAAERRDEIRAVVVASGVPGGVTCFDGILVARLLAPGTERLRAAVTAVAEALRGRTMPRVWSC